MHDVEDINYVKTLGIDYSEDDKMYTAYVQLLDFSSVAKQEGATSRGPAITYVGKGRGVSLNLALNELYNTSQSRMLWSHVTSILVSDKALKQGVGEFADSLLRYREVRYTPLLYGAHDSLEDLMSVTGFFHLSPITTIEHAPQENYKQKSMIHPVLWLTYLANRLEPGKTNVLPSLAVNREQWTSKGKKELKPEIDGAYVLQRDRLQGWFSMEQLHGLRWVQNDTVRTPLEEYDDGELVAVVSFDQPKAKVTVSFEDGEPYYSIRIKTKANVIEQRSEHTEAEIVRLAEERIVEEVKKTFEITAEAGVDVYQLEYETYLHHYRAWKRRKEEDRAFARPDALREVTADVQIIHHGMQNTYSRE